MTHNTMMFAARMFAAAIGLAVVCGAAAQSPAVSPKEAGEAKQQATQQIAQPLNNQPVWNEVRTGQPQYTSIPGRETNILVQPSGQTWRALRNGQISVYGGWALVVIFLAIVTFYWRKGTIELHAPATGRKIQRFTPWERSDGTAGVDFSIIDSARQTSAGIGRGACTRRRPAIPGPMRARRVYVRRRP